MAEVEEGASRAFPEVLATKTSEVATTEVPVEVATAEVSVEAETTAGDDTVEALQVVSDHKRKHDSHENEAEQVAEKNAVVESGVEIVIGKDIVETMEGKEEDGVADCDAKRLRIDPEADVSAVIGGHQEQNQEPAVTENGIISSTNNLEQPTVEEVQQTATLVSEQVEIPSERQQATSEFPASSRKIEVPNNKVGVLIGKAGDTIRYLQYNSGAKIQIVRDADADPYSSTRSVELIGSMECITKAEQLIKGVMDEADAGGSPALVARGFGTAQSGAEQLEIQVPNEKVGLIIGKGGETIKNLQTRSGARIQLVPQHLPEGDPSKVRTVRISGNKKHIEIATEMIQEVMNQVPGRPSVSGGYSHQGHHPHGPTSSQWGPQAMAPTQSSTGYDYQHRGMYPSHTQQYPPPYGGYHQPPPSRDSYGAGWDQMPPYVSSSTGGPAPASGTYYGQPQGSGYGQPSPYPQSVPTQHYVHGYNEPKYDGQAPSQQMYGQQSLSLQPGPYSQMGGLQPGYQQQQYSRPAYGGVPSSQGPPQAFGQPRPSQSGDQTYQGPIPSNYGSGGPQQQYPYVSGAPQTMPSTLVQQYSGSADGYMQPPPSGYNQQAGQTAPAYSQAPQPGAYGQYP